MKNRILLLSCFILFSMQPPALAADTLESGVSVETSLAALTFRNYSISVPAGATLLRATIANGTGELDLFMKYGSPLSGANYQELLGNSDFASDTFGSPDETIEVTPQSDPPLTEGLWYIAPVNFNASETAFTLTATVAMAPTRHQLNISLSAESATPAVPLTWGLDITPGTIPGNADIYAFLLPPGGPLFFLHQAGAALDAVPYLLDGRVQKESGTLLSNLVLPGALPQGDYYFGAVMVKSFADPFDPANWVSDAALSTLRFSSRSPAQEVFIDTMGHPQHFIKTFIEKDGGVRVDETWVYVSQGVSVCFINGVFSSQTALDVSGLSTQPSGFQPEDYAFDTTPGEIVSGHGQPLQILDAQFSGGFFDIFRMNRYYIYDGVIFGFYGDTLVAVAAFR